MEGSPEREVDEEASSQSGRPPVPIGRHASRLLGLFAQGDSETDISSIASHAPGPLGRSPETSRSCHQRNASAAGRFRPGSTSLSNGISAISEHGVAQPDSVTGSGVGMGQGALNQHQPLARQQSMRSRANSDISEVLPRIPSSRSQAFPGDIDAPGNLHAHHRASSRGSRASTRRRLATDSTIEGKEEGTGGSPDSKQPKSGASQGIYRGVSRRASTATIKPGSPREGPRPSVASLFQLPPAIESTTSPRGPRRRAGSCAPLSPMSPLSPHKSRQRRNTHKEGTLAGFPDGIEETSKQKETDTTYPLSIETSEIQVKVAQGGSNTPTKEFQIGNGHLSQGSRFDLTPIAKKHDAASMQRAAWRMGQKRRRERRSTGNFDGGLGDPWRKNGQTIFFLVVLGILSGLLTHLIYIAIEGFNKISDQFWGPDSDSPQHIQFVLTMVVMAAGVSLSAFLTAAAAPHMAGSGIPFMKWLMGVDDIEPKSRDKLKLRYGLVKAIGLILAASTGLNIGLEGPFVHLAGLVCFQLIRVVPWFQDLAEDEPLLRQMLVASTSVGVSSTFAATLGGVLFSIEITSTYYLVANYYKSFIASMSSAISVILVEWLRKGERRAKTTFLETDFSEDDWAMTDLPFFILLGVLCGVLGPGYVKTRLFFLKLFRQWEGWNAKNLDMSGGVKLRLKQKREFIMKSVGMAALVAVFTSLLAFLPGGYNRLGVFDVYKEMLEKGPLHEQWSYGKGKPYVALLLAIISRWFASAIGTSLVVPAGDLIQTTVMGASLGRFLGEIVKTFRPQSVPATYALIGSASMAGASTQSISAAVVIIEFTGAFALEVPVLLAVISAFGVARKLGYNIYDSVMELNGLDWLPNIIVDTTATKKAKDIMIDQLELVTAEMTAGEIVDLLKDRSRYKRSYPFVSAEEDMVFLGTLDRRALAGALLSTFRHEAVSLNVLRKTLPNEINHLTLHGTRTHRGRAFFDTLKTLSRGYHLSNTFGGGGHTSPRSVGSVNSVLSLRSFGSNGRDLSDPPAANGNGAVSGAVDTPPRQHKLTVMALQESAWDISALKESEEEAMRNTVIDLWDLHITAEIYVDRGAWMVPENMNMAQIHALFELLRAKCLFVVSGGQLKGVITRKTLYAALRDKPDASEVL
ncbi:unnamed protein product [Chrysoparadoxa australica]